MSNEAFRFCPRCGTPLADRAITDIEGMVTQEVKEEVGLDVEEAHLIGNYIFERKNEVVMCYHLVASGRITLGRELAGIRRHKPAQLRPWRRATGLAVADWMRARGLEVRWDERAPLQSQPTRT